MFYESRNRNADARRDGMYSGSESIFAFTLPRSKDDASGSFVPAAIHGLDREETIVKQTGIAGIAKYRTEAGDVIYIGSSGHLGITDCA